MQAAQLFTQSPGTDHRLAEVEQLINHHLCGDWVVRVEHSARVRDYCDGWQQWGEAFFPLGDAAPVLGAISRCRARHPAHSIRLCAEKLRPQAQLVFRV